MPDRAIIITSTGVSDVLPGPGRRIALVTVPSVRSVTNSGSDSQPVPVRGGKPADIDFNMNM